MNFQIKYSSNSEIAKKTVDELEVISNKYGNVQINSWSHRAGLIDLVTIIEIAIGWYILEAAKNYAGGFIGLDWFNKMGQESRNIVVFQLEYFRSFLRDIFNKKIISNDHTEERAVSIVTEINDTKLYVVLNHPKINQRLVNTLPEGIAQAICYIENNNLGNDFVNICQLYPNFDESSWNYLFIPSSEALGNYVDRYINLKSGKMYGINSSKNFIDRFKIDEDDICKLIIRISDEY